MQYGNFKFIEFTEPRIRSNGGKRKRALFECSCGEIKDYDFTAITTGRTKLCWKCSHKKAGELTSTHNLIKHTLYRKWQDMKKRCYNPKVDRYKNYGLLGIRVCDEWKDDFLNFYNWSIENGWEEGLTIERKDNDKNYCPENCKYITHLEQHYNKKNTVFVTINGVKISLVELLYRNNMIDKRRTIWIGLKQGKDISVYMEKYNISV